MDARPELNTRDGSVQVKKISAPVAQLGEGVEEKIQRIFSSPNARELANGPGKRRSRVSVARQSEGLLAYYKDM